MDFSFNDMKVFKGNDTAFKYDSDIYYRPYNLVFPGINSFALDSRMYVNLNRVSAPLHKYSLFRP